MLFPEMSLIRPKRFIVPICRSARRRSATLGLAPTLALLGAWGCAPPTIPGTDLVVPAPASGAVIGQGRVPEGTLVLLRDGDETHVVLVGDAGPVGVELSLHTGTFGSRMVTAPSGEAFVHSFVNGLHRRTADGTWSEVAVEPGSYFLVGSVDDLWLGWEGELLEHWDGERWSTESWPGALVQVGRDTFLIDGDMVRAREGGRWIDTSLSSARVWSLADPLASVAIAEDATWVVSQSEQIVRLSRRTWTATVVAELRGAHTLSAQVAADGALYLFRVHYGDEVSCDGRLGFSRDVPTCGSPMTGYELVRWDEERSVPVLSLDPDPELGHIALVTVGDDLWLAGRTHWWRVAR